MRLTGKVALVTGGSSGIGEEVAVQLAGDGATVAVVASSDIMKAQQVADKIKVEGGNASAYVCDIRNTESIAKLVSDVESDIGPIGILINAAGVSDLSPIGTTDASLVDHLVDINLKGTFHMINAVGPGMMQRRSGKIVNFSSIAATVGIKQQSLYCACKSGIDLLTRAMVAELAPYDVNINAVAPGATKTPMNEPLRTLPEHRAIVGHFEQGTPSNHTFSEPGEIASMVVFLCSDAARPMHGSIVLMDEGASASL